MIKAILFDMDGVVVNSEPLYERVEKRLFAEYGISVPDDDWKCFKGTTEQSFFGVIEKRYEPKWDREEVIRESRKLLVEVFESELTFMPGFLSLLQRIKRHYVLGLVTSTGRRVFEKICEILPLRQIFHEIICADDIVSGKPHPEPYLAMMKQLSVFPEEAVVVEDSIHGVASAKAAGVRCIALAGSVFAEDLRAADIVVESLDEITDELLSALWV